VDDFWTFLEAGVSITIANGQVRAHLRVAFGLFSGSIYE
jgi:hypothetical protein